MGKYQFENTIQLLLDYAHQLTKMQSEDIPEALPVIGTLGKMVSKYKHTQFDWNGIYDFSSEIPDALAVFDVTKKMSKILKSVNTIIKNFFPEKGRSGDMNIELDTKFEDIENTISSGLEELKNISNQVFQGMSDDKDLTIDLSKLRYLRNYFIVIAIEFIQSNFQKIPIEFTNQLLNITNQQYLKQANKIIQPEIANFSNNNIVFSNNKILFSSDDDYPDLLENDDTTQRLMDSINR